MCLFLFSGGEKKLDLHPFISKDAGKHALNSLKKNGPIAISNPLQGAKFMSLEANYTDILTRTHMHIRLLSSFSKHKNMVGNFL